MNKWNSTFKVKPSNRSLKRARLNKITKDPRKLERRFVPPSIIRAIKARSGGRCEFVDEKGVRCDEQAERTPQHVVPRSLGGKHTLENLKDSCWPHNQLAKTDIKRCRKLGWDKPYEGYVYEPENK